MGIAEALGDLRQQIFGSALRIGEHITVPEADHPPSPRLEKYSALRIVSGLLQMPRTINLDSELRLPASEIDNIGRQDELAGEFRPIARKKRPENMLRCARRPT